MTVSGKIDSINRIRLGEEGRQTAKIFELRADRVHKDQWRPVASLFVTQAKRIRYLQEVRFGFGRSWHLSSLLLHMQLPEQKGRLVEQGSQDGHAARRCCGPAATNGRFPTSQRDAPYAG